jgi:hypothetical protein
MEPVVGGLRKQPSRAAAATRVSERDRQLLGVLGAFFAVRPGYFYHKLFDFEISLFFRRGTNPLLVVLCPRRLMEWERSRRGMLA